MPTTQQPSEASTVVTLATDPAPAIAILAPVEISARRLCDLVTTAFEGGSTYWLRRADYEGANPKDTGENIVWWGRHQLYRPGFAMRVRYDDPNDAAGEGKGGAQRLVTFEDLKSGLIFLAQTMPQHFSDFMAENEDADTADAFMQLTVLGGIVYG